MGKVFRLAFELNLFLPCFGLSTLYSRIGDPARRPGFPQQLYSVQYGSGKLGRDAPPPCSHLAVLCMYGFHEFKFNQSVRPVLSLRWNKSGGDRFSPKQSSGLWIEATSKGVLHGKQDTASPPRSRKLWSSLVIRYCTLHSTMYWSHCTEEIRIPWDFMP